MIIKKGDNNHWNRNAILTKSSFTGCTAHKLAVQSVTTILIYYQWRNATLGRRSQLWYQWVLYVFSATVKNVLSGFAASVYLTLTTWGRMQISYHCLLQTSYFSWRGWQHELSVIVKSACQKTVITWRFLIPRHPCLAHTSNHCFFIYIINDIW